MLLISQGVPISYCIERLLTHKQTLASRPSDKHGQINDFDRAHWTSCHKSLHASEQISFLTNDEPAQQQELLTFQPHANCVVDKGRARSRLVSLPILRECNRYVPV